MFGLKIVKSQDYSDLNWRLGQALKLVEEKEARIAEQNDVISKLNKDVTALKAKLEKANAVKKTSSKVVLLTDVAETPLVEEPKSEGKPKRVVKKTNGSKTRKKVVRKAE